MASFPQKVTNPSQTYRVQRGLSSQTHETTQSHKETQGSPKLWSRCPSTCVPGPLTLEILGFPHTAENHKLFKPTAKCWGRPTRLSLEAGVSAPRPLAKYQ